MPKVEDVMDKRVASVFPSIPVINVAQQMLTSGKKIIPVCDNNKFHGVIAEHDIVSGIVAAARDPVTELASSVVNAHFPTISPDSDIMDAAMLMANNGVQVLPVVKNGKLMGMFSLGDLALKSQALAALVFSKSMKAQELAGAALFEENTIN